MTRLFARVRTGNIAVPDANWTAWSPNLEADVNVLNPWLMGQYIQIEFTMISADRTTGPFLRGFRLCHGCGKDAM